LGFPTGWLSTTHKDSLLLRQPRKQLFFWRHCRGTKEEYFQRLKKTSRVNLAPAPASSSFSGAVAGEEEKTSARGVFAHTSFTLLLLCFTLFILLASFYIKTQKKLESLVVVFTCLL
jgi:hypothetical protein